MPATVRIGIFGTCLLLVAGCGSTHSAGTTPVATRPALASTAARASALCAEAQREIDVILRHGVDPSPTVLPTEIPRTARESLPVIDELLVKLRRIGGDDPPVQRALRDAENNRSGLAKLAKRHLVGAESAMHAILSSDAACVAPRIGN